MAEFLTTHATGARLEEVVNKAQEKIVLISPYLKLPRILFERLLEADQRGVQVTIVFGKKDLDPEQRRLLSQLTHLKLYFCEHLHAKCYYNEMQLIITSLNLHEYSERNNREMGVCILATDRIYKDAVAEAESIIKASVPGHGEAMSLSPTAGASTFNRQSGNESRGSCIRCRRPITRNPDKPFCPDCFDIWVGWENQDFEERCCHMCGRDAVTSMRRPLCGACFRNA